MLTLIKNLISANMVRVLAGFFAVLSVAGALLGARQAGKNAERVDELLRQAKFIRRSHEIEDETVRTLDDGDAVEQLRDHWSRKTSK